MIEKLAWAILVLAITGNILLIITVWQLWVSKKVKQTIGDLLKDVDQAITIVKEWLQYGKDIRGQVKEQNTRVEQKLNATVGLVQEMQKDMPEATATKVIEKIAESGPDSGSTPAINSNKPLQG